MKHRFIQIILAGFLVAQATAQNPFEDGGFPFEEESTAVITPEAEVVEAGWQFQVAFDLKLKPHYHAYYKNPGSTGSAPSVKWELPDGFSAGTLLFPRPEVIKSSATGAETISYGYEGQNVFVAEIEVKEGLEIGQEFEIKGTFNWQECEAICMDGSQEFSFKVKIGEEIVPLEKHEELFETARKTLPQDASAWGFNATEKENVITLQALFPKALGIEEPIYFFSNDNQIDAQAAQKVELKELPDNPDNNMIEIILERNQGNEDLFLKPGPVLETLSGLLVFNDEGTTSSAEISMPLSPDADIKAGGKELGVVRATEAEIKAGAEVYDAEKKVEVVTLGGQKEKEVTFLYGMGLLFLGGLILNLMPCVFPVLGLKVMGFVSQAGEDESKIKLHGLVFGLGLLVAMWILAAVVISLGLKWGEQLANPVFLVSMIIFFYLMGLNLFGLFEVGTSLTGVGGELQAKKGYSGSFFSGVLTTLVATPCSGPFLGVAMAFALALPPVQAFAAFTVFGLGIASPYILLSFFPALIKKLPRPGAWMESFKQIMSFFLIGTAIFFMDAYLKLVGQSHFNHFLFALVVIGMGFYLYGRWGNTTVPKMKRSIAGYGLAGVMIAGGLTWAYSTAKPPKPGLAWQEWYPGIVEISRPKKRIIWVDYTADW
jgi:thiol:disulfide interchange protein DsbD